MKRHHRARMLSLSMLAMLSSSSCFATDPLQCESTRVTQAAIVNAPPSILDIGDRATGIWLADRQIELQDLPSTATLAREMEGDFATASGDLTVFAFGPVIAAEDKIEPPEISCTQRGVLIKTTVRLATPPGSPARRRVLWRPIIKTHIHVKTEPFTLASTWVSKSPDARPDVIASVARKITLDEDD